jgi:hypothetical protein
LFFLFFCFFCIFVFCFEKKKRQVEMRKLFTKQFVFYRSPHRRRA